MNSDDLVLSKFLFMAPPAVLENIDRTLANAAPFISDAATSFTANLKSAAMVSSLPFTLTQASVVQRRFDRLHTAERIRTLKDRPGGEVDEDTARNVANTRFNVMMNDSEYVQVIAKEVVSDLGHALRTQEFAETAAELLRQSLVMIWGAFETLASDVVIAFVNTNPAAAISLTSNQATKRFFPTGGIPIEELVEHGFSVGNAMGNILFHDLRFESLPFIRAVVSVLFANDAELRCKVSEEAFWVLWQRRHLIVHKRGIVDRHYLDKVPDTQNVGDKLSVSGARFEEALTLICEAGRLLIVAASGGTQ